MAGDARRMTFIVIPQGGEDVNTRSFEISYRRLRVAALLLLALAVAGIGMAASWFYIAAQAARVPGLVRQVDRLDEERERVVQLAQALARLEEQYQQVRGMLGADDQQREERIWLPPIDDGQSERESADDSAQVSLPTVWPLGQEGFITRGHLGRVPGQHPGIDIAVAEGSYIRAAGAGTVTAAGEDPIYGRTIRIRHGDGYESRYGHASQLFVQSGDVVARGEVIALSGNTGTSTAPHLHFEILKDGEPVDPRTLLQAPN